MRQLLALALFLIVGPRLAHGTTVDGVHYPYTNVGIQAAINATPAGGLLRLPTAIYALTGTGTEELLITKSINVVCDGWGSVLQVGASVPNTTDVFHIQLPPGFTYDISIENCFITSANGTTSANGRYGISIDAQNSNAASLAYAHFSRNFIGNLGGNYSIATINPATAGNGSVYLSSITDNYLANGGMLLNGVGDSIWVSGNQITYYQNLASTSAGIELTNVSGAANFNATANNITTAGGAFLVHAATQPKFLYNQCEQLVPSTNLNNAMVDLELVDTALVTGNNLNSHGYAERNVYVNNSSGSEFEGNVMSVGVAGVAIYQTALALGSYIGPNTYYATAGGPVIAPAKILLDYGRGTQH